MKKFKKFISPILITALPSHGSHSIKQKVKTTLKEAIHQGEWYDHNENSHLGEHKDAVHKHISMSKEDYDKHPDIQHVKDYSYDSFALNDELARRAKGKTRYDTKLYPHADDLVRKKAKHDEQVKGIDNALKHSKLKHDVHVYHGTMNWNPGEHAAEHHEGKIKIPTYVSTSINKKTAHDFGGGLSSDREAHKEVNTDGHILHIHLKKGQHGLYIGDNTKSSKEDEMLLPRDKTYKVHPTPTKLSDGTHIWHAHIVD